MKINKKIEILNMMLVELRNDYNHLGLNVVIVPIEELFAIEDEAAFIHKVKTAADPEYSPFVYPSFLKHINVEDINIILELGAKDGMYTNRINEVYKPKFIYSIDANPESAQEIKKNQKKLDNVEHTAMALGPTRGNVPFYIHPNGGSHSFYKHPEDPTREIIVPCITLDTFCGIKNIKNIDLICADVEGAEPSIFKDQKILETTKYIITEVKFEEHFWGKDYPGIDELTDSLRPYGFHMVEILRQPGVPFGDSLWVKL
jgi:FkbM family methyltransferase